MPRLTVAYRRLRACLCYSGRNRTAKIGTALGQKATFLQLFQHVRSTPKPDVAHL
jgi:hypothetical protein